MSSLWVVSDRLLGLQKDIDSLQGRDLESAFEAGPSSSSGQQDGREVSFKGVGTFQVDTSEQDRLLRKERANAKASMLLQYTVHTPSVMVNLPVFLSL